MDYLQNTDIGNFSLPASKTIRFVNFIVDLIVVYMLNVIAGLLLIPFSSLLQSFHSNSPAAFEWFFFSIPFAIYFLYYFLMESLTKGQTVGKLITSTRVVDIDDIPIRWKGAFSRSVIRLIPVEPLSAFGTFPWHDSWTYTLVIKEKK